MILFIEENIINGVNNSILFVLNRGRFLVPRSEW